MLSEFQSEGANGFKDLSGFDGFSSVHFQGFAFRSRSTFAALSCAMRSPRSSLGPGGGSSFGIVGSGAATGATGVTFAGSAFFATVIGGLARNIASVCLPIGDFSKSASLGNFAAAQTSDAQFSFSFVVIGGRVSNSAWAAFLSSLTLRKEPIGKARLWSVEYLEISRVGRRYPFSPRTVAMCSINWSSVMFSVLFVTLAGVLSRPMILAFAAIAFTTPLQAAIRSP